MANLKDTEKQSPNAVYYLRVSSKPQEEDGLSLDVQQKVCEDYAEKKGLVYEMNYSFKATESAWKTDRKCFHKMVQYVKQHINIKYIVFYCEDRISRNWRDLIHIEDLIKKFGKHIVIAQSGKVLNDDNYFNEGRFLAFTILMSKEWSEQISRKVKEDRRQKFDKGVYATCAPIGYLNTTNKVGDRIIVPDSDRKHHIQEIFKLALDNDSDINNLVNIAKQMKKNGLRSKKGEVLTKSQIAEILHRKTYCGYICENGKEILGNFEPIIKLSTFEKVQERLTLKKAKANKTIKARGKIPKPFNGLIKCGEKNCGHSVTGDTKIKQYKNHSTEYAYYACNAHRFNSIRQEEVLKQAESLMKSIRIPKLKKSYLKRAIIAMDNKGFKKRSASIQSNRSQMAKLEAEMQRVIRLSSLPENVVQKTIGNITNEMNQVKTQLEVLENTDNRYMQNYEVLLDTIELSKDLFSTYSKCSLEKKAKILYFVLSHCSLKDKTLVFKVKKPFCFMQNGSFLNWLPGQDSNLRQCD